MSDYFITKRYFVLIFISLIIFMHMLQSLNNVEFTMESFVNDQSVQDLLAKNNYFVPKSVKKIDWHDYDLIERERLRKGLGEQGKPAYIINQTGGIRNSLNEFLSNKISMSRSLPDVRHPKCMKKKYIESLPSVSVIIPFRDEHIITLVRTVRSVISRSPPQLIKEILLINYGSKYNMIQKNIKDSITKYVNKVKLLKSPKQNGIIRAKLHGAKEAKGDVLVFLVAHCEVNVNWLPPLLEPIALDYRTVMCPVLDKIDGLTFEYKATSEYRGGFDWNFNFKLMPLLKENIKKLPEPYENPVMTGGITAISRIFFWKLGGYDPGLYIWGGDQYELSFKTWQCGGRMLTAPCSRVGLIIDESPFYLHYGYGDFIRRNNRRVAAVWMDDFAQKVYMSDPLYSDIDSGDISEQQALRRRLQCKPFSWFMSQVAVVINVDYGDNFPLAEGQVRPLGEGHYCLDADSSNSQISLKRCSSTKRKQQTFIFTYKKSIKSKGQNMCWDLPDPAPKRPIYLKNCYDLREIQKWRYDFNSLQIMQSVNCLDWDRLSYEVFVQPCDEISNTQQWVFDYGSMS